MWSMTPDEFISVVYKEGGLQVRSRDRASIESFCRKAGVDPKRIVEGGGTDYAFRVRRVSKLALRRYNNAVLDSITYPNFKNEAKARRGKSYANALSRVWTAMLALEPKDAWRRRTYSDEWVTQYYAERGWPPAYETPDTSSETSLVSIEDYLNMSPDDKQEAYELLSELAALDDEEAQDLKSQIDMLERVELRDIADMTDEEFAEFERSE